MQSALIAVGALAALALIAALVAGLVAGLSGSAVSTEVSELRKAQETMRQRLSDLEAENDYLFEEKEAAGECWRLRLICFS